MQENNRNIKLIWDFKGEEGYQIALHHEIHLKQFAKKEGVTNLDSGVEQINSLHYLAYITVPETEMRTVRDALIPHRGEVAD